MPEDRAAFLKISSDPPRGGRNDFGTPFLTNPRVDIPGIWGQLGLGRFGRWTIPGRFDFADRPASSIL